MADFLDTLANDAAETIASGYYASLPQNGAHFVSLKRAILESKACAIITEIKKASPSAGILRGNLRVDEVAAAMEKGGAVGISVLTEPKHFEGSLGTLRATGRTIKLPILMKDIILNPVQLQAASRNGANAILLIQGLFDRGYVSCGRDEMIANAHALNLEVLLEAHSDDEFRSAVDSRADLVGINNRNLVTLKVDLKVTKRILEKNDSRGKTIISESGINTPKDVRFLRGCGARAFLVGSAIMLVGDVEAKVKELVSSA